MKNADMPAGDMGLARMWVEHRPQIVGKRVDQVIGFAGAGKLTDGGETSSEFRAFLRLVDSGQLSEYSRQCLEEKFDGSGFALQDIVNEMGRRLGFQVTNGRYRGTSSDIGNDGLWKTADGKWTIIVEVKTTDAYRFALGGIDVYRAALSQSGEISKSTSSILIVVGREDTGGLESQIRGSRLAWDVRLISVDGLQRLIKAKEALDDPRVHAQFRELLRPHEYTRVDGIIELFLSAIEEVQDEAEGERLSSQARDSDEESTHNLPMRFNEMCIARVGAYLKLPLVKQSKVSYATPNGKTLVICTVSREYGNGNSHGYWFAFHPHQKKALEEVDQGYLALGCGSDRAVLLVPSNIAVSFLKDLWTTERGDRTYWHLKVDCQDGKYSLRRTNKLSKVDLGPYLIS